MAKTKAQPQQAMKYIGNGASIPGIPARDLTSEEVASLTQEQRDALVASGLYQLAESE